MYAGPSSEEELEKNASGAEDDENELEQDDLENPQSISGIFIENSLISVRLCLICFSFVIIQGLKKYESKDLMVTVKTSEISQNEDEDDTKEHQSRFQTLGQNQSQSQCPADKKRVLPPKKKLMKKPANKKKKHGKSESKRKKGAKKGKKR